MILCVGPKGCGKTLLLKRLQLESFPKNEITSEEVIPTTVPTVGINITTIKLSRKVDTTIHELGGAMAPIWPCHFSQCRGLMFVIDTSNLMQISAACIQLYEIVTHESLQTAQILIILNKIDVPVTTSIIEVKDVLRLEQLKQHAKQSIETVEVSAFSGDGVENIRKWLLQFQ
ncbi:ADP-ribosylation factor-like protein 16 [Limulus polyphemus]|uniref:ADP-ribosylation factor-like protein 16 n=1 Tax=Limulus polyphemus TaxID=6850 RepID=A0ABM1BIQ7_LIMPO|nr:ADP-ribosylation factor-like protein 16 [Limulus polyphemus]